MIFHYLKERYATLPLIIIPILVYSALSFADADKIFNENNNAVVVVVTYDKEGNAIGQGSGFIVRADGAIVTNYHVISNAMDIKIKAGSKILKVEGLLHIDKENDIVILKVLGEGLPTVKLGDIAKVHIGEKVYVISSPQGLENTISDGILSGIREIAPERKVLQITAPISPGSSGGPVFNKNGEVIGIATFLIEQAQNLNFAMPVNLIKDKTTAQKVTVLKDTELRKTGSKVSSQKTMDIIGLQGYYINNTSIGRLFVIEGKLVSNLNTPKEVTGIHGMLFDKMGKTIKDTWVAPGRIVSRDELKIISSADLEKRFKDINGAVPPKGTVPFMLVFQGVSGEPSEFSVEIGR